MPDRMQHIDKTGLRQPFLNLTVQVMLCTAFYDVYDEEEMT